MIQNLHIYLCTNVNLTHLKTMPDFKIKCQVVSKNQALDSTKESFSDFCNITLIDYEFFMRKRHENRTVKWLATK